MPKADPDWFDGAEETWVGPGDPNTECKLSTTGEHPWVEATGRKVGSDEKTQLTICVLCGAVQSSQKSD